MLKRSRSLGAVIDLELIDEGPGSHDRPRRGVALIVLLGAVDVLEDEVERKNKAILDSLAAAEGSVCLVYTMGLAVDEVRLLVPSMCSDRSAPSGSSDQS